MKTKVTITSVAAIAACLSLINLRAQSPTAPVAPCATLPYGKECVITMDPKAWSADLVKNPAKAAGFFDDWTTRGQLIYPNAEWCVLKDGTFENWIPRDKVLMIRASK